ncbi:hypothetical protein KY290_034008 [Solanum tuberosum]|uniref:Histidine decarboxylase n=1 Tax=Solanum tuberosum TaxID=4113 RepID=A0ABQ7U265_SOLTU|nr:hypothetical protein KY289_033389 [Solanum tuberosum]KAH0648027.1 hypothetical protein KY285_033275 [Solanum tuberosum]KAH0740965.1 hypothetical protein KY290_034008 [Solanum tuberosum]
MGIQREFDSMIVPTKGEIDAPSSSRKNLCLSVVEPDIKDETSFQELDMILTQYLETLSKRKKYHIGTTFKGAIDDLDFVIQTLENCGYSNDRYYIHCDAALCGLILPFIRHAKKITFKKPIGSISISSHKFLGCPMPCGIQITRKSYVSSLSKIEYINSRDATISGSRNGLTPIFLWYCLSTKGHARLQQDSKICIENARYLKDRLLEAGISAMLNEFSITVVFERPYVHKFIRRWNLCYLRGMAHVVVMPGITREIIDSFFKDLMQERNKWYQYAKALPPCLADDFGSQNCMCSDNKMHN